MMKNIAEHLLMEHAAMQSVSISITAAAGGRESGDFATMLKSMYSKWAARRDFWEMDGSVSLSPDDVVKDYRIHISGRLVYGWLRGETGIHRLVRVSPHDEQGRRHTSFVSVIVRPIYEMQVLEPYYPPHDPSIAVPDVSGPLGCQIRSYVLHPYQKVKDLRTGHEADDAERVLAGDIDDFLAGFIVLNAEQNKAA